MNFRTIFFSCLFFASLASNAAVVDTVSIYSQAMNKTLKCIVIRPDKPKGKKAAWPVVYLLHGHGGWYSNWILRVPELSRYADAFRMMIVCPDGHNSSWYIDSPVDSTMRYETHIAKEIPAFIDANYPTIKKREARAITGLSMGGYGGLFIGFRHSDHFGACGSMSGVMDLNASRNRLDIQKRIGDTIQYADNWKKYSMLQVVEKRPEDSLAILIDCGMGDTFFPSNKALHEKMLQLKIPHEYIERPGKHDWNYWRYAVKFQLFFFRTYFDKNRY